jgi:hypothetical protein
VRIPFTGIRLATRLHPSDAEPAGAGGRGPDPRSS